MDTRQFTLGPVASAACLLRGLRMLAQPGMRRFVWAPLLINLLLYALGAWAGAHYFSTVLDGLIPAWLEWLRWLLWPLFAALFLLATVFTFTLVANLIAAPFYGPLAEKALSNLGVSVDQSERVGILAGLWGDVAAEIRRMAYFALRALPLLLLSVIPGVNLLAPLLWLLFGAWSLSLEYLAYPLETLGMRFDRQRQLARTRRLEALAFGGAVLFGLGIPVLNILIPPAAVVGAAIYVAERRHLLDKP